jgi:iron complex transport system permease protein
VLAGLAALAGLVLCAAPFTGMRLIGLADAAGGGVESAIFWNMRVPRVLVAFLAGSGLALAGMAFQAMFRNPLATPFTLGVASGASFGAALYVHLGLAFTLGILPGVSAFAFLGALLAIGLVYGLTRGGGGLSTNTLLLAGVAVSFTFSSLILLVQYITIHTRSMRIVHWLMGELAVGGYPDVFNVLPFAVGGAAVILFLSNELNLLTTGEDLAATRGVEVGRVKTALFLVTSLTVAGVVAVCGPIGFVGMMVPHVCRMLVGSDHRWLGPASLLSGGTFLVVCDRLSCAVLAPAELPVGIVTALLGGPFFLWLLLRRGRSWSR